jgi:NHLM bacteriocin system secretion protein
MSESFYRKQALDAAATMQDIQRTMRVTRTMTRVTSSVLATALALAVTWSGFVKVPLHVQSHGVLVSANDVLLSQITPLAAGYVSHINVRKNSMVKKGDVLAVLTMPDRLIEVRKAERALESARLNIENKRSLREADAKVQNANFQKQLDALEERIATLKRKQGWLVERSDNLSDLSQKGYVAQDMLTNARIASEAAGNELADAYAQRVSLRAQQDEAETARQREELADEFQLIQLRQELEATKSALKADSTIIADVEGRVANINTRPGALASPGQALFEIIPHQGNEPMKVEAITFVPLDKGKRLKAGDQALVTPSDLPEDVHDKLVAKVKSVSDVPMSSTALQNLLGDDALVQTVTSKGPVFEVRLVFEHGGKTDYQWTSQNSPQIDLTPGTPMSAQITMERTPLLALAIPAVKQMLGLKADNWTGRL